MRLFASTLNTMLFSRPTRFRVLAAILTVVVGMAGAAFGRSHHGHRFSVKRHSSRHQTQYHGTYRHPHGRRANVHRRSVSLGQRAMDAPRATEIQQALIAAHYLSGSPTGQWDAETQTAMQKYQADNGWQSKITPDSRAIIKLGLGPKQDDGEYATSPAGVSSLSAPAGPEQMRTMATSETSVADQN